MYDQDYIETQIKDLYHNYSNHIYRYILVMIGEHQQAKDLMQETFVKAFKNFNSFRGDSDSKTWLYRIARNVTIDYLRQKKPLSYLFQSFTPAISSCPNPQEVVELGEDIEQLYHALAQLRSNYREVIILRKIKEFSIKETAKILGWKESKVKTMLHRGLQELKKQMIKEGYTGETAL